MIYGRRYKDVENKLVEARGDAARGITYDAGKQIVEEYLARWLADSVRDTVRLRTYERYESTVRVHLIPAIGSDKLKTLTPAHVRGLYRSKLDSGLAPRTVLHIHRTLSKALKQAHDDGLIPRNVAGPVKPPRPRTEEIRSLDREQVRTLFEAAIGDRVEALYVVAVTAGLRRGELQGLRWEDVDPNKGALQVRRTLSEPKGGYIFEAPKSGKGRNIRLTQTAVAALREHRRRQLEERVERGSLWQENGLVFTSGIGTPLQGGTSTVPSRLCYATPVCPRYASTIFGTPAPRCCCGRASTPSSSKSCWATPTLRSPSMSTRTYSPTWATPPPAQWTLR